MTWLAEGEPDYDGTQYTDGPSALNLASIATAAILGGDVGVSEATVSSMIRTALLTGAGFPLTLAPTSRSTQASPSYFALALASGFTPVNGHKYRINGIAFVRTASGSACTVRLRDQVVRFSAGSWSALFNADADLHKDTYFGTVFGADDDAPSLGSSDGTTLDLSIGPTYATATFEFDGTIADNGTDA